MDSIGLALVGLGSDLETIASNKEFVVEDAGCRGAPGEGELGEVPLSGGKLCGVG